MVGPGSAPRTLARLGAATAGLTLGVPALWLAQHNLRRFGFADWFFWVPITAFLTTLAALCWWFALRGGREKSRAAIEGSWRGGLLVGCVGFVLGFFGPLVIWPDANLGPLLGILFMGPLGFVLGALGALALRSLRSSR